MYDGETLHNFFWQYVNMREGAELIGIGNGPYNVIDINTYILILLFFVLQNEWILLYIHNVILFYKQCDV